MSKGPPIRIIALGAIAALARGELFTYECDVLPVEGGWELFQEWCDPEEWLDDGWVVHHVEPLCEPDGGQIDYWRDLDGFAGMGGQDFFAEWRVITNGSADEFLAVAPAVLALGGQAGINYHFTIAADTVRLSRDVDLPVVFVDVDPKSPHTYRIELYADELYVWYVDGQVVDSGVPEGDFLVSTTGAIAWRSKSWLLESTTRWDYFRYGHIPIAGSGDADSSTTVTLFDFFYFQECLDNGGTGVDSGPGCVWADGDGDGDVDFHDFGMFQRVFTGSE